MKALLKTLYLLTSVRVNLYVFNNDDRAFYNILAGVRDWHVETESRIIFHNVKVVGESDSWSNVVLVFRSDTRGVSRT